MTKRSQDAEIRWLLRFLETDLAALTPAERMHLDWEAATFGVPRSDWDELRLQTAGAKLESADDLVYALNFPPNVLRRAQGVVSDGLASVRRGETWVVRVPGRWELTAGQGRLRRSYVGSLVGAFVAQAAELLVEHWPRMRTCARDGCARFFLPVRKQIYCSGECSRQVQWRKFTDAHPTRDRDHHAEYVRRRQRELGSNVVVGRKKRR